MTLIPNERIIYYDSDDDNSNAKEKIIISTFIFFYKASTILNSFLLYISNQQAFDVSAHQAVEDII
jgi:hypothetical protein